MNVTTRWWKDLAGRHSGRWVVVDLEGEVVTVADTYRELATYDTGAYLLVRLPLAPRESDEPSEAEQQARKLEPASAVQPVAVEVAEDLEAGPAPLTPAEIAAVHGELP